MCAVYIICIPDSEFSQQHELIDAEKLESRNRFNEPDFIQQQPEQQKMKIFIIMK